jgi:uncharacterized membrane protein
VGAGVDKLGSRALDGARQGWVDSARAYRGDDGVAFDHDSAAIVFGSGCARGSDRLLGGQRARAFREHLSKGRKREASVQRGPRQMVRDEASGEVREREQRRTREDSRADSYEVSSSHASLRGESNGLWVHGEAPAQRNRVEWAWGRLAKQEREDLRRVPGARRDRQCAPSSSS